MAAFEIIEELGQQHEEENEEKFRERKQLGFNEEWTLNGEIKDCQTGLPFPIMHRPRLGARILVRSYVRRYIKAIFHELGDWLEEKHKTKGKRKSWRKLHLGLDLVSGEIVCSYLTTDDIGDPTAMVQTAAVQTGV